jgi:nucleoside recognition membrane protein YjiH
MLFIVLPYLILIALVAGAVLLVTSKRLAEKFVAAGLLPSTFLGIVPILRSVIRVFGVILVAAGVIKIGMDSGWIDAQLLSRYAFPGCLICIGAILLFFNRLE